MAMLSKMPMATRHTPLFTVLLMSLSKARGRTNGSTSRWTRSLPPSSSYRTLALPLPGDLSMRQQAMLAPSSRPTGPKHGSGGATTVPILTRSCGRPCTTISSRKASTTSSGCGPHRTTTVTAANTTRTPTGILATSMLTSWVVTSMATMQHRTCKSSTR